jgi:hypothetical protein
LSLRTIADNTTAADRILFSLLIVLSLSGILFMKEFFKKDRSVHIAVEGRSVYILPIEKNRVVSVEGPEGRTFIEIKDQKVRILESPCRNRLCMQQGWISSGALICLPNRVIVTIGDSNAPEKPVDATAG